MKYVYCVARDVGTKHAPSAPDAFPPGLGGAEVYDVSFGGISVLTSDVDSHQPVGNVQNALAHQEVVNAALRLSKSVIPCRFGTLFSDDKNILAFLKEHYALLDAHLTRLEGKIEVSVQVILTRRADAEMRGRGDAGIRRQGDKGTRGQGNKGAGKQGDTGISYLLRKKEQFDGIKELDEEADRFSRELDQAMSPFWSDAKVQKAIQERTLLLSLYYLVDEAKLPAFKLAYQTFKKENPSLRLLYTGPWAPYNFADIDLKVVSR